MTHRVQLLHRGLRVRTIAVGIAVPARSVARKAVWRIARTTVRNVKVPAHAINNLDVTSHPVVSRGLLQARPPKASLVRTLHRPMPLRESRRAESGIATVAAIVPVIRLHRGTAIKAASARGSLLRHLRRRNDVTRLSSIVRTLLFSKRMNA
jgi:hypothetical protein